MYCQLQPRDDYLTRPGDPRDCDGFFRPDEGRVGQPLLLLLRGHRFQERHQCDDQRSVNVYMVRFHLGPASRCGTLYLQVIQSSPFLRSENGGCRRADQVRV